MGEELNYRQKKFCRELIKDKKRNATKAAIKAGYSKKSAYNTGYRMMKNDEILEYIQKITEDGTDTSLADVLEELKSLSFSKITDYLKIENKKVELLDTADIPEEAIPAIKKVKQKVKQLEDGRENIELEYELYDKIESLKTLGSHLGLGKENKSNLDEHLKKVVEAIQKNVNSADV